MVTLRQFLVDVVGQDEGFICLATKVRPDGAWDERHFAWPRAIDDATAFARQSAKRENLDLYFCTQLLSDGQRTKGNVKSCACLWTEVDGGVDPSAMQVQPSIVVQSSAGRYHAYWLLDRPVTPQAAEEANKRIAYYEGADKSSWALGKVLRIPGTKNWKRSVPEDVTLLDHNGIRYTLSDFDVYPEVEASSSVSSIPIPSLAELEELGTAEQILYTYRTADEAGEIEELRSIASEDRSKALFKLIRLTTEAGMTRAQSFLVITGTANDKWSQAPLSNPDLLWNDIDRVNKRSEIVKLGPEAFFDKKSGPNYQRMAEYIVTHTPLALGDDGFTYSFDEGTYTRNDAAITDALIDLLQHKYKASHKSSVSDIVLRQLKINKQFIQLTVPGKISCANGVLDLDTLELSPHSPTHYATAKLPVEWDPKAPCEHFLGWAQSLGIAEYLPILEEYIALALDPVNDKHHAVILVGPSHSGKSTYIRFIQAIMGRQNSTSISLHAICEDKFAAAHLYGKLLNTCGDISGSDIKDVTKFLGIAGGDTIQVQHKYKAAFDLKNQALMVFSTNSPPSINSANAKAYRNRMAPFFFSRTFEGHENPHIESMIAGSELPGILYRLVEARNRTKMRGRLPDIPAEFKEDFAGQSDRVLQWLQERCDQIPQGLHLTQQPTAEQGVAGQDLLDAFNMWAEGNKFAEMGRNTFYQALEANGIRSFNPNRQRSTKWFRVYLTRETTNHEYEGNVITVRPSSWERKQS